MRVELRPRSIGRIAGGLFVASGALSAITLPLPQQPGLSRWPILAISIGAMFVGALVYFAPWHRWPRGASQALVPLAFLIIATGNYFGSSQPYSYSVFFVVAFVWIGITHPRWTSVRFAPAAAVAYAAPLLLRPGHATADISGAVFAIPAFVLVAEVLAWVVAGEQRTRQVAHSLASVASALGRHLDQEALFETLVEEARPALDSEHAVIYEIDVESMTMTAVYGSGLDDEATAALAKLPGTKINAPQDQLSKGETLVVENTSQRSRDHELRERFGVKSYIAVPIMARETLVGVLSCWETSRHRRYLADERSLAEALAAQASVAIENAVLYEKSLEAARCDPLTGLGNRRAFRERLESEVERARRYGRELSLILLDADRFKAINDSFGHQAGDRVLIRIGEQLQRNRRMEDGTFRIGGDEFAVLLPETGGDVAGVLAERLRRRIERASLGIDRDLPLTASFGVASFGDHGMNVDDLFGHADGALYDVKAAGGNAVALSPRLTDGKIHLPLGVDIDSVIDDDRMRSMYQPIYDLRSGGVFGFETFCRLDESAGYTPTPTLFRAAAAAGRLDDLERLCRRTALSGALGLSADVLLFLNVSPAMLSSPGFDINEIVSDVRAEGIVPGRVVIEVTEQERAARSELFVKNLRACQQAGLLIGLDDFGLAASDLDLLATVRFDYVKVDMGFFHELTDYTARRRVLKGLAVVASESGALAIAEGLETLDDLRIVRDLGFCAAQGFLLREPAPVPDLSTRPLQLLTEAATG